MTTETIEARHDEAGGRLSVTPTGSLFAPNYPQLVHLHPTPPRH
jgi:hypothetical protein